MLRWWSATPNHSNKPFPVRQRRAALRLEALEARDCPSTSPWDAPVPAPDAETSDTTVVMTADPVLSPSTSSVSGPEGTVTTDGEVPFTGTSPASDLGQDQPAGDDAGGTVSSPSDPLPSPP